MKGEREKTTVIPGYMATRWYCFILLAFVFVVYGNTLQNGYAVDDVTVITQNSYVQQGLKGLPDILTTPRLSGYLKLQADSYRPTSLVLFAIEQQLWGDKPMIGHFFNIVLFACCVIALFLFLDALFEKQKTALSFFAALLFAAHPIHTEVVANIKSADELLAYFFGFASLLLFMNYSRQGNIVKLLSGFCLFFLACMSKESVLTFVAIIPLIFFAFVNDNKRRGAIITAGAVCISLLYLCINHLVLSNHHAGMQGAEDFTTNALLGADILSVRVPTALYVLGKYLMLLFVPYPLLCNYSYSSIPFAGWTNIWVLVSALVYCLLFAAGTIRIARRKKDPLAFAILFFLITISLFSNLFFLVTSQMAERFLFFPSTGFCIAIAWVLGKIGDKTSSADNSLLANKGMLAFLLPIVIVFSSMTIMRNRDWKDNETLFSADLSKSPDDCKLNYYKAISIPVNDINAATKGQAYKEKAEYLKRALAIYPDFAEAHTDLAKIYEAFGMYDSALAHNLAVLRTNTENSIASYHAASEYYALKNYEEAILWYKATIRLAPDYKLASLNLAKCFADAHVPDSAIVYFRKVLALDEQQLIARRGVAIAFLEMKQYDSAAYHMLKVIAQQPRSVDDINNLGAIYLSAGNYPKAIEQFRQAIAIEPKYTTAYANIAATYEQMGMKDSASLYKKMMY